MLTAEGLVKDAQEHLCLAFEALERGAWVSAYFELGVVVGRIQQTIELLHIQFRQSKPE